MTPPAPASSDLTTLVLVLAVLALAPFVLTMVTSFAKLVIVGSLVRTALGTQQVPPTIVITGLAMILSAHVMWPVGARAWQSVSKLKDPSIEQMMEWHGKLQAAAEGERARSKRGSRRSTGRWMRWCTGCTG